LGRGGGSVQHASVSPVTQQANRVLRFVVTMD